MNLCFRNKLYMHKNTNLPKLPALCIINTLGGIICSYTDPIQLDVTFSRTKYVSYEKQDNCNQPIANMYV